MLREVLFESVWTVRYLPLLGSNYFWQSGFVTSISTAWIITAWRFIWLSVQCLGVGFGGLSRFDLVTSGVSTFSSPLERMGAPWTPGYLFVDLALLIGIGRRFGEHIIVSEL